MTRPRLRDKDIAVLCAIQNGARTVSEIKAETTLTTREINYNINEYSLEDLGFIDVDRLSGREWREINGQEKYIWRPKTVQLTDNGIQTLAELEPDRDDQYKELNNRELLDGIDEIEKRQDRLEKALKNFRENVINWLNSIKILAG